MCTTGRGGASGAALPLLGVPADRAVPAGGFGRACQPGKAGAGGGAGGGPPPPQEGPGHGGGGRRGACGARPCGCNVAQDEREIAILLGETLSPPLENCKTTLQGFEPCSCDAAWGVIRIPLTALGILSPLSAMEGCHVEFGSGV